MDTFRSSGLSNSLETHFFVNIYIYIFSGFLLAACLLDIVWCVLSVGDESGRCLCLCVRTHLPSDHSDLCELTVASFVQCLCLCMSVCPVSVLSDLTNLPAFWYTFQLDILDIFYCFAVYV